jgi:hypothetical protein
MLPDHCKDVSVRKVDFELTEDEIARHIVGKKAYTRTEFIILKHDDQYAVVRVFKEGGVELFRLISAHKVISLPDDTVFVKDEEVDVLNRPKMAAIALRHPGKTVIVQGLFNHVSFVQGSEVLELHVLDVVPPRPAKLSYLVAKALDAGLIELPILVKEETVDLNELERRVQTPIVVFPCRASGLESKNTVFFLDETPRIEGKATLVGCELSLRIYQSIYKKKPEFISMCPREFAPKDGKKRLVKCCQVKEGFELEGDLAIVPWGATVTDVVQAIRALFKEQLDL